jgi:hypothetical protein
MEWPLVAQSGRWVVRHRFRLITLAGPSSHFPMMDWSESLRFSNSYSLERHAPVLDSIGGVYCENCNIARIEPSEAFGVRPYAIDPERAERLWHASARLTGLDIAIT